MSWSSNLDYLIKTKEPVNIRTSKEGIIIVDSHGDKITKVPFDTIDEAVRFLKKVGLREKG